MKRFILTAMMLVAITAQGQYVIDKGNESKQIDADRIAEATYAGSHNGQTFWIEKVRHGWQLLGANHNMELTRAQAVRTEAEELLAAGNSGDTVVVVLADRSQKRKTSVLVARNVPTEEWTVDTLTLFNHDRKDDVLLWAAKSPSGNHIGLCSIVRYNETHQYSAFLTLLDGAGYQLWMREFPLGTMHNLYVTDDGRMATVGTEQDGPTMHIIVNYADQKHAETNEGTVTCEPARELKIVNVIGGRMLAMGTIVGSGFKGAEKLCGGVIVLSYDLDSALIASFSIRPFQNEDMNILFNKPTKKVTREQISEHTNALAYAALPYGGAIALGRNYEKINLADNGTEEHSFTRLGIHIVAADKDGNILWVRNLRRNDFQKRDNELLHIGMVAMGDDLCVVKSEHRKFPIIYDIAKEAKRLTMGDKSNLVLYTIAPDGEVKKDILEAKSKHTFLHFTPEYDIITMRGNKLRDIKLSKNQ